MKQNEKTQIEVKFAPIAECRLHPAKSLVLLSITSGPTYTFQLSAQAKKPAVELSFLTYDFGPCFVLKQPLAVTTHLEMRNRDVSAMSIETNFIKQAFLDVGLASGQVILPLQTEQTKDKKGLIQTKELNALTIPITFTPRECVRYEQIVTFDINGLHKIDVVVKGEGTPFKLELDKSED